MSLQSQPVSIEDLFRKFSNKLQLNWVGGQGGKNKRILLECAAIMRQKSLSPASKS